MKTWLVILSIICLIDVQANACFQTEVGDDPLVIKATSLNGRATVNKKPIKNVRFELYKAITFDRQEGKKVGLREPKVFKTATSNASGLFTFGEVPPGRYWLVDTKGLLDFRIEVAHSLNEPPYKRLWYDYFADGCESLVVEEAN